MRFLKNLLLILFLHFSVAVFACEMKLAPILLFMSKTMTPYDWQPLMKNSNCSPEITQNIFERLKNAEGKISTEQFIADYSIKIDISPAILEVINLETLLRKKTHTYFKKISISGALSNRLILLDSWDQITLQCQNCEQSNWSQSSISSNFGSSNFGNKGQRESTLIWQLQLKNLNETKNLLVTTEVANMTKVFRTVSALPANTSLNHEQVETTYLAQDKNENVFDVANTDLANYELVTSIKAGEVLTTRHVRPKRLVQLGKNIEAIFKNKGIELNVPAQALQSGGLGQIIQIKNLKNNKQLSGEIIGQNKVLVTL